MKNKIVITFSLSGIIFIIISVFFAIKSALPVELQNAQTPLRLTLFGSKYGQTIFILIIIALLLVYFFTVRHLTKRILEPIEKINENLEDANLEDCYDEMVPALRKIFNQNSQIAEQVERLLEERNTINTITKNMKDGLILLDKNLKILSVNLSAVSLLGGSENEEYVGKPLLALSRNIDLIRCCEDATQGSNSSKIIEIEKSKCSITANPAFDDKNKVKGITLFIIDITKQLRLENQRKEFSSNVSHELRTPLATILGFSEILKDGIANQDDVSNFSTKIYDESKRVIAIVDDIMRLSQLEEERSKVVGRVNFNEICENVKNALDLQVKEKNVTLSFECPQGLSILGNARMLEELIYNLCENGIKYNVENGSVVVKIYAEMERKDSVFDENYASAEKQNKKAVVIQISDTGIGISKEHQDRIFERFYRVDKSRSKKSGGTGLGLSIVKHIVDYHEGEIQIQSEEGVGTTITVKLPTK